MLERYHRERTDHLPSHKHARLAGRTLLECWGATIRAAQITEAKQKEFCEWSIEKGHSLSYISRNLSVCAAAFSRFGLPIKIWFGKKEIADRWNLRTKAPRKGFVPTDAELAKFLSTEMPEDLFRWCVMAALTVGRPEAVLDLTPASRNRAAGLIDLNPGGRAQNKKYRPLVREPKSLTSWLNRWEKEGMAARPLNTKDDLAAAEYCRYSSVDSLQTALQRTREKAGLPLLSVYSFRHKGVTVMRQARVSEDEIARQVGHRRPGLEVTAGYGEWSPDYLANAAKALNKWWVSLAKKAGGRLNSRRTPKGKS